LPGKAKVTDGNMICQGSEKKVGGNRQLQVKQPTSSTHAHCGAWHEQCTVGRLMKLHHFRDFLEFNTKDFQQSSQMIHSRDWLWVPPSSYSMATKGSFSKIKVAEHDHWPPHSAKMKNNWSYTSTPPCLHMDSDNCHLS